MNQSETSGAMYFCLSWLYERQFLMGVGDFQQGPTRLIFVVAVEHVPEQPGIDAPHKSVCWLISRVTLGTLGVPGDLPCRKTIDEG